MTKTLVQLMEWSHQEFMYGRITEKLHQSIHTSWEKITETYYAALEGVERKDEFVKQVFELAFGEFSFPPDMAMSPHDPDHRMPFEYDEVIEKIQVFETNSFKVEDLEESEGFSEGDTIKIMGTKYVIHIGSDDEMSLEKENES